MATNKNALQRYRILDKCLSGYNRFTFQELSDEVNARLSEYGKEISDRTIRDDLKFFRSVYGAEIITEITKEKNTKEYVYHYRDPHFTIFKSDLDEDEVFILASAIEMLSKFRGGPANAWLDETLTSLEYRFGIKANQENLISFEQNTQLKGTEHLSGLMDATIAHQPLEIKYRTFKGRENIFILHPYYMKQYSSRWFLFGWNDEEQRIVNLALDRIQWFKNSIVKFRPNTDVDFTTYFNNIIGVTLPNDDVIVETVILKFSPRRFPYVVTKPIHISQQVVSEEECMVSICVKPNKEFYQRIFSFIPDIEVVSPEWLRTSIQEKIEDNLQIYKKS